MWRSRRAWAMCILAGVGFACGCAVEKESRINLGAFSVSLAVEDLERSREFYQKMGFRVVPAEQVASQSDQAAYNEKWVMLRNGEATIGLFQKMFETNTLTFNPPDVRAVQRQMKAAGLEFALEADEASTGPAAASLFDPDGTPILLDQHSK